MPATIDLYTGPWRGPSNTARVPASSGPVVIALKRIVSRARPDLFTWRNFDGAYNRRLEKAVATIQRAHGLPGTGQIGSRTFATLMKLHRAGHTHELAADNVAYNLLEDAWAKLHPPITPLVKVQEAVAQYCQEMESYSSIWHYLQRRPFRTLGVQPYKGGYNDCSEYATDALYFARMTTGVFVPDPNDRGFDGWGNSDTLYHTNVSRTVTSGHYEIGDYAIYGPSYQTHHVTVCRTRGSSSTAIFSSEGSEAGPLPTRVYYRSDLLAVVRPRLVP